MRPKTLRRLRAALVTTAFTQVLLTGAAHAQAVSPSGGTVAAGQAGIASNGTTTTVTQQTDRAVIDWRGFDVGTGHGVVFAQPGSGSATLNRVIGSGASAIAGSITSNGAVYLVNPNGIAITATGSVQTGGGFVASTLDIADKDFMGGKLSFAGVGGSVSNAGRISTGSGAYVALLGGAVANSGVISVPMGRVGLGAGSQVTLDLNGDGFMQVAAPASITAGGLAPANGRVAIGAAALRQALRGVVNLPGNLSAVSAVSVKGGIVLGGMARVPLAQVIAPAVTPATVLSPTITMSGTINVDSAIGNAGRVEIIGGAGSAVSVTGTLSARATGTSGNGGLVETSGASVDFAGLTVDTSAPAGIVGTWLIDPTNLTVDGAAAATISGNLANGNVMLQTTRAGASGPGTQSGGGGDIVVNSAIGWTSANTLTLSALGNIAINAAITGPAGALALTTGNSPTFGPGTISASGGVNVRSFYLVKGYWLQNSTTLPAFSVTDFNLSGLSLNNASFFRAAGGDGSNANPYKISDVYGLQGIGTVNTTGKSFVLTADIDASGTSAWYGEYGFVPIGALASNSGSTGPNPFMGTLDGAGHSISGLVVNTPGSNFSGLIGYATGASTISNLNLAGGSISGGDDTGALVGSASGTGSIFNITSSVNVTSTGVAVGGIVGATSKPLTNVSSSGNVTGKNLVGGVAGAGSSGSVSGASATGAVTGVGSVGGLIGNSNSSVTNSYATGSVTGTGSDVGGLIGFASGTVSKSYATGTVRGGTAIGGLIGAANAGVDQTYATGAVTATGADYAGGLVGVTFAAGAVARSYATGAVTSGAYAGGLIGESQAAVTQSYATGAVTVTTAGGGVAGYQNGGSLAASVYWDSYSTGLGAAVGSVKSGTSASIPVTSDPTQTAAANYAYAKASYANLASSDWVFFNGQARPFGAWEALASGATITNTHQLQLVGANGTTLAGSYTLGGNIDLSETGANTGTAATSAGMWSAKGFVPIGTDGAGNIWNGAAFSSSGTTGFTGALNGGGFTIGNLTIARTGVTLQALIGFTSGAASLSNIGLTNVAITGGSYSGGLLGHGTGTTQISNDYSTGAVNATNGVGGLAGYFQGGGSITNSYSTANVSGTTSIGGLIGTDYGGVTSNSYATGLVSSETSVQEEVGGLVGNGSASFINDYATGNVVGAASYMGGLIGFLSGGSVIGSHATGLVMNEGINVAAAGGLIGFTAGPVTSSYATGAVIGPSTSYVGGLIGEANYVATVSGSSASGNVSGAGYVGGLIGDTSGAVIGSSASGTVSGGTHDVTGGLIGYAGNGMVTGSSASGNVSGAGYVGGLIGWVYSAVSGSSASGNVVGTGENVGGLIGYGTAAVSTSFATGSVRGSSYVGGLIGFLNGTHADIDQTYATGAVTATSPLGQANPIAGGLIGAIVELSAVSRSYETGSVTASSGAGYLGGLIGQSNGTLTQDYATGAVGGATYRGGVIGYYTGGRVAASDYWDSYSTGVSSWIGAGSVATTGTAPIQVTSQSGSAAYPSAYAAASYANLTPSDWVFFNGQTRPFGAWEVPASGAAITNTHQLQLIGANAATLTGSYTLGANINLAETGANKGTAATSAGMWAATGFVPIGTDGAGNVYNSGTVAFDAIGVTGFAGLLNGAGYTLSNLTSNRPGTLNVGLFGFTTGTLRNLTTTGGSVTGGNNVGALTGYLYNGTMDTVTIGGVTNGSSNVGGIVGSQYKSAVTNSTSSGAVSGALNIGGVTGFEQTSTITGSSSSASATASKAYAGGLVGYQLNGTINSNVSASGNVSAPAAAGGLVGIAVGYPYGADTSTTAVISNASATGAVTGSSGTGGLVGFLGYGATVAQAYATGAVNGGQNAGGLIGYQYLAGVSDSYATGAVSGTSNVAGLVGIADGSTTTIARTYATGAVTGTGVTGGLVGQSINGASVTASVWDVLTTGQSTSAGGTGYTTAQLQDVISTASVYRGWDFTGVWLAPNQSGQNGTATAHYPRLRARPTP